LSRRESNARFRDMFSAAAKSGDISDLALSLALLLRR
jgi:hypothetical protein